MSPPSWSASGWRPSTAKPNTTSDIDLSNQVTLAFSAPDTETPIKYSAMRMTTLDKVLLRARAQDGVTMMIAMGVMLVTSLLLTATFLAARGTSTSLTRTRHRRRPTTLARRHPGVRVRVAGQPGLLADLRKTDERTSTGTRLVVQSQDPAGQRHDRMHHLQPTRNGDRIDRHRGQHVPRRIDRLRPARAHRSNTRSSPHSKSRVPQLHLLHEPRGRGSFVVRRTSRMQRRNHILSRNGKRQMPDNRVRERR